MAQTLILENAYEKTLKYGSVTLLGIEYVWDLGAGEQYNIFFHAYTGDIGKLIEEKLVFMPVFKEGFRLDYFDRRMDEFFRREMNVRGIGVLREGFFVDTEPNFIRHTNCLSLFDIVQEGDETNFVPIPAYNVVRSEELKGVYAENFGNRSLHQIVRAYDLVMQKRSKG